jgi:L-alanine-DL-glutamate epimerase-like enolase superfamily enzyme
MVNQSNGPSGLLANEDAGSFDWGIMYNSVVAVRSEPLHAAEMVTQALLGTPVKLLEQRGDWRKVQLPDLYVGWVDGSLQPVSRERLDDYLTKSKLIVTANQATAFEEPDCRSLPMSDLVAGNILVFQASVDTFYRVCYPDGREAYVCKSDALPVDKWLVNVDLTGESIVKHALQLLGVPYLWGGTSTKGLDCSGLTKQVYLMHGIMLPRDASQQAMQGEPVDTGDNFSNARSGDLLFFVSKASGDNLVDRVTHVAIYMDDMRFIHASDHVRIGSFNPNDPLYDAFNANRYFLTKRFIRDGQTVNVETLISTGLLTGPIQETASISTQGEVAPRRVELSPQTAQPPIKRSNRSPGAMKLTWLPYELKLTHRFTLSGSSRTVTPAVLTRIEYDGLVGYGEASLPPYLGESPNSVIKFLKEVDLSAFRDPTGIEEIMTYVDGLSVHDTAAKASVDIALHDLTGKILDVSCHKLFGLDKSGVPNTTFTIGMDSEEVVRVKTWEAVGRFNILKVKVGGEDDRRLIRAIRSVTDLPLAVDANQGWSDWRKALDMILWMAEQGVVMVEQPLAKHALDDTARLTEASPIPIFADESLQRLGDLQRLKGVFSGVNIKLMKCTGMHEAWKMRELARLLEMKVMIGCMTETSCAISAAAQLSPGVDFADLDGALLIVNDCFEGARLEKGKIIPSDLPGIGALPVKELSFGR